MTETTKVVPRKKPQSLYGRGQYKWEVTPDYWKLSWGEKPVLGHVYADDDFYAKRIAYDKGLLPYNYTFGPEVRNVGLAPAPLTRSSSSH